MLGFQTEIVLDFDSGEITRQSDVLVLLWFGVQLELTKELRVLCKTGAIRSSSSITSHEMFCQRI